MRLQIATSSWPEHNRPDGQAFNPKPIRAVIWRPARLPAAKRRGQPGYAVDCHGRLPCRPGLLDGGLSPLRCAVATPPQFGGLPGPLGCAALGAGRLKPVCPARTRPALGRNRPLAAPTAWHSFSPLRFPPAQTATTCGDERQSPSGSMPTMSEWACWLIWWMRVLRHASGIQSRGSMRLVPIRGIRVAHATFEGSAAGVRIWFCNIGRINGAYTRMSFFTLSLSLSV